MQMSLQPFLVYRAHIEVLPVRSQPRSIVSRPSHQEFLDLFHEPPILNPNHSLISDPILHRPWSKIH